jgi:uncharacterized protein
MITAKPGTPPKIHFRDTGLLHGLLGHPMDVTSWECFALEQALQILRPNAVYFWGTRAGAELDLVFQLRGERDGMETKFGEAPTLTPSMRISSADLYLDPSSRQ